MSPARAILLHSPGRKPWVNYWNTFIEPQRGGTSETKDKCSRYSAAPTELLFLCTCLPRVSFRALPSLHPGLCRSGVPTALIMHLDFDAVAL